MKNGNNQVTLTGRIATEFKLVINMVVKNSIKWKSL